MADDDAEDDDDDDVGEVDGEEEEAFMILSVPRAHSASLRTRPSERKREKL